MGTTHSSLLPETKEEKLEKQLVQKLRQQQFSFFTEKRIDFVKHILREVTQDESQIEATIKFFIDESAKPPQPSSTGIGSASFLPESSSSTPAAPPKEETTLEKNMKGKAVAICHGLLNLDVLRQLHADRDGLWTRYLDYARYGFCATGVQIGTRYIVYFMPDGNVYHIDLTQASVKPTDIMPIRTPSESINLSEFREFGKLFTMANTAAAVMKEGRFDPRFGNCHHFVDSFIGKIGLGYKMKSIPGQPGEIIQRVKTFYAGLYPYVKLDSGKVVAFQSLADVDAFVKEHNINLDNPADEKNKTAFSSDAEAIVWLLRIYRQTFDIVAQLGPKVEVVNKYLSKSTAK